MSRCMTAPTKDILASIEREHPTASRSALSRWMRQNHDALLARIGERPDWTVLSEVFAKAGLTDRTGKPASAETARKAWQRVRKEIDARRSSRPSPPQKAEPEASKPAPATPESPRRRFVPSTPKPPKLSEE